MVAAESLVGGWRLESFRWDGEDGSIIYPFGQDAVGYVLFDESGFASVSMMAKGRPNWASGDPLKATAEELRAAMPYTGYAGRYEVQGDRLIAHVEVCYFPNWVGTVQVRLIELEGDRLTMSTPPIQVLGVARRLYLKWKRVHRS